jgi:hypothetical protein
VVTPKAGERRDPEEKEDKKEKTSTNNISKFVVTAGARTEERTAPVQRCGYERV